MWIDPKNKLPDPESYINFIHYQDIDTTTCHEDLKEWCRCINIACLQIENSKGNKPNEEKARLEEIRFKGVKLMQKLEQKLRNLSVNSA